MRINGTVSLEMVVAAGGRDSTGASKGATLAWSDPMPCHIATNTDTRLGRFEDGTFRMASFTVLVEPGFIDPAVRFQRVRLRRAGEALGIYPLAELTPVIIQNRLKLVVYND